MADEKVATLLDELPSTSEAMESVLDSLNWKQRAEYSAKLALRHKDSLGIRPLIKAMLSTECLASEISVQKQGTITDDSNISDTEATPAPMLLESLKVGTPTDTQ